MIESSVKKQNMKFEVAPSKRARTFKKSEKMPFLVQHPTKTRGVVYINHLPHGFYENQLHTFLSQFGTVTNLRVGRSSKTGRVKGYAFVEFLYPEVAEIVASSMNNYLMFKKILKCTVVPKSRLSRRIFRNKVNADNPPALRIRAKSKHALNNVNVSQEIVEKRKFKQYGKLIKLQKMLEEAGIQTTIKIPKTTLQDKSKADSTKEIVKKTEEVKTPSQRPLISLVVEKKQSFDQTNQKQNSAKSPTNNLKLSAMDSSRNTYVTPKNIKAVEVNTPQSSSKTPKNLKRPAQASPETPLNKNKKVKTNIGTAVNEATDILNSAGKPTKKNSVTTPGKDKVLNSTPQALSNSKNSFDQAEDSSSSKMPKSESKKRKRQSISMDPIKVVEGSSKQEDANLSVSSNKKGTPKTKKVNKRVDTPLPQKKAMKSPLFKESNKTNSPSLSCTTTPVSSKEGKKNVETPSTSKKNKTPNSKVGTPSTLKKNKTPNSEIGTPSTSKQVKTPNSKVGTPSTSKQVNMPNPKVGSPLISKKNKTPNSKLDSPSTPLTSKKNKTASPSTPLTSKKNKTPNSKTASPSTPLTSKKNKTPNSKTASPSTFSSAKKVKMPNSKLASPVTTSIAKKVKTPNSKNESQITPSIANKVKTPNSKVASVVTPSSGTKKANTPTSKSNQNTPKAKKGSTPGSVKKANMKSPKFQK